MLNIRGERSQPGAQSTFSLFALGFRPFFLGASLAGIALIAVWVVAFATGHPLPRYYGPVGWHSHEMIFGYSAAVIAGFLLTAVPNWTGLPTPKGGALAALSALWLAGRIAPFLDGVVAGWAIALVDLAFFPALAAALAFPLIRAGQRHNLMFLPILGVMTLANLLIHLQALQVTGASAYPGINLAINVVVLLMAVIGGRVIPYFAERALPGSAMRRWPVVEWLSIASLLALIVVELVYPKPFPVGILAALAGASHATRLWGWHIARVWSIPLLWVLYLGYGWLVVGFVMKALAAAALISPHLAVHAFTAGGIGVLTLGMMARVALGHTGRPLVPARLVVVAFVLINLAAFARSILPTFGSQWYMQFIDLAGLLWIAAFLLFAVVYAPIVIRPRIDGRPG